MPSVPELASRHIFGVEVESYKPRTPPFMYDAAAHSPIIAEMAAHMKKMPPKARFLAPDAAYAAGSAVDPATGETRDLLDFPRMTTEFRYFSYKAAKADVDFDCWKVTTDASIRGDDGESVGGLEFVTPKLPFSNAGLEACKHFVLGVACAGFIANDTTALHVHVSCGHLTNEQLRRFAQYLVAFEAAIDQYITPRRREDNNRFIRSNLQSVSDRRDWRDAVRRIGELDLSASINPLVDCLNVKLAPAHHSERNHKVNFILLRDTVHGDKPRRVEFRQHHGTTDPHLVVDWASFCVKFLAASANAAETPIQMARRLGIDTTAYGEANRAMPASALWELIADDNLEQRFVQCHAAAANVGPKDFAVETREMFAFRDDAYADAGDINDVLGRRLEQQQQRAATPPPSVVTRPPG